MGVTLAKLYGLNGSSDFEGATRILNVPSARRHISHYDDRHTTQNKYSLSAVSSLAFYLMLDGGNTVSLNQLIEASKMMDSLANLLKSSAFQRAAATLLKDAVVDYFKAYESITVSQ